MTENEKALIESPDMESKVSLIGGIRPKDFADLTRFAQLVQKSHLAPKGFDSVEKVAIGILTNMELGRPIITGLQDLAIINGRCGIYGDASLAMVTASRLMDEGYPLESETGTPYQDSWTFIFKVKRIGQQERVGTWTWIDSKRAGFDKPLMRDGKPDTFSPWTRFTRRMMQWKARNYVLRDTFGDVLKGMKTVEDLHDLDPIPLEKQSDGTYKTQELEPPDTSKFDALLAQKVVPDDLSMPNFLTVTATAHNTTIEKLKAEAGEDFDRFWKAFEKWQAKQKPAGPKPPEAMNWWDNEKHWKFKRDAEVLKKVWEEHQDEFLAADPEMQKDFTDKFQKSVGYAPMEGPPEEEKAQGPGLDPEKEKEELATALAGQERVETIKEIRSNFEEKEIMIAQSALDMAHGGYPLNPEGCQALLEKLVEIKELKDKY